MSMFVHLPRTPNARYAIGAAVSWPIYGVLYLAMLEIFDRHYAAAAGISWILSYGVVYAFQKYGGLSAAVNFGLGMSLLPPRGQLSRTRFTRSVVTDDQGRYVLPDLPKAKYKIWFGARKQSFGGVELSAEVSDGKV
jgi:hypothetical protein